MTRNLVLFGMMGTGKSTVARAVGERLGRDVVDTDEEVERAAGRTVVDIFASDGEAVFRRHERAVIEVVADREDVVVSVGGGAVLDARNVACLRRSGVLVELRADPAVLAARLAQQADRVPAATVRPLLEGRDLVARVSDLSAARRERYAASADHHVNADVPVADVAEAVLAWAVTAPGVLSVVERERVAR